MMLVVFCIFLVACGNDSSTGVIGGTDGLTAIIVEEKGEEMSRKGKIILSVIAVVISMALLIISAFMAEDSVISPVASGLLVAFSVALVIVAISFAAKVDYETGVYECRKCGNVFKPTFRAYLWGAHTLTTRCLKCPKCKETSWCKRKMDN